MWDLLGLILICSLPVLLTTMILIAAMRGTESVIDRERARDDTERGGAP